MTAHRDSRRLIANRNGWIPCPECGSKWLHHMEPGEECERLVLMCRTCKRKLHISIHDGQCFYSPSL